MSTDEDVAVRRGKVCTKKNDRVIFHLGQPQIYFDSDPQGTHLPHKIHESRVA
jgi:hypothetical protein